MAGLNFFAGHGAVSHQERCEIIFRESEGKLWRSTKFSA
jgi:hypothetical protein